MKYRHQFQYSNVPRRNQELQKTNKMLKKYVLDFGGLITENTFPQSVYFFDWPIFLFQYLQMLTSI